MGRWFSLGQSLVFCSLLWTVMAAPYTLHQLVVVDAAGDAVIRLNAYDTVVPSNKVRSKIYWELSLIIPYHTTEKLTKKIELRHDVLRPLHSFCLQTDSSLTRLLVLHPMVVYISYLRSTATMDMNLRLAQLFLLQQS